MTSELCVLRRHKTQEDKIHMWFKYVTVFQGHLYIITSYTQHEGCTLYIYGTKYCDIPCYVWFVL